MLVVAFTTNFFKSAISYSLMMACSCYIQSVVLDASRQYSCAYFEKPDQTLDDAQRAKQRHLAAKLLLGPDSGFSISVQDGVDLAAISSRIAVCWLMA